MAIGQRILQTAKRAGISQTVLARKLGIGQTAVSMWGKGGAPSIDKIIPLAEILGVSIEYLFTGNSESSKQIPDHTPGLSDLEVGLKIGRLEGRIQELEKQVQRYEAQIQKYDNKNKQQ